MKTILKIVAILMVSALVFSCGGSGGSSEDNAPVKVSFNVETPHADLSKVVSVNDPNGTYEYYYAAIPQWTGVDFTDIKGFTGGTDENPEYEEIENYVANTSIGYFAQGTWNFYVQVKYNNIVIYSGTKTQYINASSTSVSVDVVRTGNGSATVNIDIEVPIVSAGTVLTATYGTEQNDYIGLTKTTMASDTNKPTHGAGWARFIGSKSLDAGAYEFKLTSKTAADGSAVGGSIMAFDVIAGLNRAISGTIENGVWQTTLITINLPTFTVVTSLADGYSSALVNGKISVAPSTNLGFKCTATPGNVTGTVAYQWYVNDTAVPGETESTFTFNKAAQGYYYVACKAYIDGVISGSHMLGVTVTN